MSIGITDLPKIFKPENLKYLIVVLGFYLIYRGFDAIEDGVIYLSPEGEHMQISFEVFDIGLEYYALTMAWPIIFALLNSVHKNIRVDKPFFNLILYAHLISINIAFVGTILTYKKMMSPNNSFLESITTISETTTMVVYLVSTFSIIFSFYWYSRGYLIFTDTTHNKQIQPTPKDGAAD